MNRIRLTLDLTVDEVAKLLKQFKTDNRNFFYLFSLSGFSVKELIEIRDSIDEVINEKTKDF